MYTRNVTNFFFIAGMILTLLTGLNAATSKQSVAGKDRDSAIVLLPLPFEQDSDLVTIKNTDDAVWFLFYAQKGQVYSFLFSDPEGKNVLKTEMYGVGAAPEQTTEIDLAGGKKIIVSCQAKETGNYYMKVILKKNGPFKAIFVYQSGAMKPQS